MPHYELFNSYIASLTTSSYVKPLVIEDVDGSKLTFLFEHYKDSNEYKQLDKMAYDKMKDIENCHVCAKRFKDTYNISDMEDSIYDCFDDIHYDYVYCKKYKKLVEFTRNICENKIVKLILLEQESLFGFSQTTGGYSHIMRPIKPEHRTIKNGERTTLILDAIQKYIVSGLFDKLFTRLVSQKQGIDSLKLIKSYLEKMSLSDTLAIDWCISFLNYISNQPTSWDKLYYKKKMQIGIYFIVRAELQKREFGVAALLFDYTYSNIIDILENAKTESSMIEMCNKRFIKST